MRDDAYVTLDMDQHRNAPAALLGGDQHEPALGTQQLHGLPFKIGSQAETAFIGLGEGLASDVVAIEVDRVVFTVLFAHRLVGSEIPRGGPVGRFCAEYV